ncbi:MAG: 4-hydroxy-tetrahydrodipicolinate reductase [Pseudodesulfovibrio sp.]|uniref:4-hydroxy-tetrahydrodipicolinate reductase n=1 Tax=Pseudodesulfovibrio aespoeensis (strain ATCC 700646 / DSM 10631 / Aspo-2) TaxID=643562 RepID=E6VZ42_PSEA9|nr:MULTISPECIES: 4-hydroxy-tetrahydrodipicolinate reductase [Pseudodesulfovibrio]MBU4192563.1 4-hydroxy-tetrahydrodipicolinate reductase [Pseudomonadota bacterium]ADU62818.1 dihydrodipicolinate reductase [Pseudodesulfovibrio aespoeensis Aspo-2]MBU4243120.1 4-hydroxy-tetrahydrodipicolinate reductase [Pseudomonadota bacterium]MBU4378636.1 4-hydroxy-tetrahydrodipicolinate reductase [Pseudomonadota bacterium]MBU4474611.1 4-hydroxy-tetrahydrodipicolinate reductase [Pseudomonadota bacterium]
MATNVVILGAKGRMGNTLVNMALADEELNLVGACEREGNASGLDYEGCHASDCLDELLPQVPGAVVVDFTVPVTSVAMAKIAARFGNPVVIGTTGLDKTQQAELAETAKRVPLFWAPNMSVGVNVLLKVLPALVQLLGPDYDMEMVETHHKMKKDSPSGTALKLAQCLAEARGWDYDEVKRHCRDGIIGERPAREIGVQTLRGGDVFGDHTMYFFGPGERIEITHRAHSRDTFATGALRAAKWLAGQKPGRLYTMADIL